MKSNIFFLVCFIVILFTIYNTSSTNKALRDNLQEVTIERDSLLHSVNTHKEVNRVLLDWVVQYQEYEQQVESFAQGNYKELKRIDEYRKINNTSITLSNDVTRVLKSFQEGKLGGDTNLDTSTSSATKELHIE